MSQHRLRSSIEKCAAVVYDKKTILPPFPQGNSVPKLIHQTFPTRSLPPFIEENVLRLRRQNPGWQYRLYDDEDIVSFIAEEYGEKILTYYNRIDARYGAARADLFRYLLLYRYGGVYLDIKSGAEKALDEVIKPDDVYILSTWNNTFISRGMHPELLERHGLGEFQQWHIIAAPGHPFLKTVIERVLSNIDCYLPPIHETGEMGVLRVTGPIAYTLAIIPLQRRFKHRIVCSESDLGLRYSVLVRDDSHTELFRTHYKKLSDPIIDISFSKKIVSEALRPPIAIAKAILGTGQYTQ